MDGVSGHGQRSVRTRARCERDRTPFRTARPDGASSVGLRTMRPHDASSEGLFKTAHPDSGSSVGFNPTRPHDASSVWGSSGRRVLTVLPQ